MLAAAFAVEVSCGAKMEEVAKSQSQIPRFTTLLGPKQQSAARAFTNKEANKQMK